MAIVTDRVDGEILERRAIGADWLRSSVLLPCPEKNIAELPAEEKISVATGGRLSQMLAALPPCYSFGSMSTKSKKKTHRREEICSGKNRKAAKSVKTPRLAKAGSCGGN